MIDWLLLLSEFLLKFLFYPRHLFLMLTRNPLKANCHKNTRHETKPKAKHQSGCGASKSLHSHFLNIVVLFHWMHKTTISLRHGSMARMSSSSTPHWIHIHSRRRWEECVCNASLFHFTFGAQLRTSSLIVPFRLRGDQTFSFQCWVVLFRSAFSNLNNLIWLHIPSP